MEGILLRFADEYAAWLKFNCTVEIILFLRARSRRRYLGTFYARRCILSR